ncbi:TIGR04552 family protein [Bdellovibrionota bacterium FG-1]
MWCTASNDDHCRRKPEWASLSDVTPPTSLFRTKYDFRWDVLDVIIGGKSTIDTPQGFQIQSLDEANRFIMSYGYDLDNPIERAEVMGNFHEALNFVRKFFLQPDNPHGLRLEIPRQVVEMADIRELFLMASLTHPLSARSEALDQAIALRNWACSLLKVMHTIAHIDKDLRSSYFGDLQQQIFDRFYRVIHRTESGQLYLGENDNDPLRVDLVAFETKPKKSRDSTILKLLHKPENVAEDIFDRVGLRFVSVTRLGALRVVKYLRDKMIVMPPNIKPSRSRNTLVDLDNFKNQLGESLARADAGEISEEQLLLELETACLPPVTSSENPHSSEFYRAIQFTCRQLIKLNNPLYDDVRELKSLVKQKGAQEEIAKRIDRIDLKYLQREIRFFYPFEVQIMDVKSADQNEKGHSAHSEYKKAQVQTALRRVMGGFLNV